MSRMAKEKILVLIFISSFKPIENDFNHMLNDSFRTDARWALLLLLFQNPISRFPSSDRSLFISSLFLWADFNTLHCDSFNDKLNF